MRYAKMRFSEAEIIDLLKAWIATAIAFGIYFMAAEGVDKFLQVILIAACTAGVGFIAHELMHKYAAHRFGVHSEFRSHDGMLVMSIAIAFLGVIFAAPGAVYILGNITRKENGIISAAGPFANMVLVLLFLPLVFSTNDILTEIGSKGMIINAYLGVFNLLPMMDFDGHKILAWSKPVYFGMLIIGGSLLIISFVV
jgi:Zn-dependent protease